jgi:hypothetical protein
VRRGGGAREGKRDDDVRADRWPAPSAGSARLGSARFGGEKKKKKKKREKGPRGNKRAGYGNREGGREEKTHSGSAAARAFRGPRAKTDAPAGFA